MEKQEIKPGVRVATKRGRPQAGTVMLVTAEFKTGLPVAIVRWDSETISTLRTSKLVRAEAK